MSFVLCIFDNIVGPKIVHHWTTERQLEDHLLKYIAIHTLNGELYQDQLVSQHKYRLYLIKEVELAVFSIFFDASTIQTCSYGQQQKRHQHQPQLQLQEQLQQHQFHLQYQQQLKLFANMKN